MSTFDEQLIPVWVAFLRSHSVAVEAVERALKDAGLPPLGWYDVLVELLGQPGGLRQFELCDRVLLSKHNLSRLLDRLEQRELIQRAACPQDGRGSTASLTVAGKALMKQMWPVYRQAIDDSFARHLTFRDIGALRRITDKLLHEGD